MWLLALIDEFDLPDSWFDGEMFEGCCKRRFSVFWDGKFLSKFQTSLCMNA